MWIGWEHLVIKILWTLNLLSGKYGVLVSVIKVIVTGKPIRLSTGPMVHQRANLG